MRERRHYIDWSEWIATGGLDSLSESVGKELCGCGNCMYGIVSEPDTSGVAVALWLRRVICAAHGAVLFCDCPAGKAQEAFIAAKLKRIPGNMLTAQSKAGMVAKRDRGYYWTTGSSPLAYIPSTTVQAVLDAIEAVPTIHGSAA